MVYIKMLNNRNLGYQQLPVVDNIKFGNNSKIRVRSKTEKLIITVLFIMAISSIFLFVDILGSETAVAETIHFEDFGENVSYKILNEDGSIMKLDSSFYQVEYDTMQLGEFVVKYPVSNKENRLHWIQSIMDNASNTKSNFTEYEDQKLKDIFGSEKRANYVKKYSREYDVPVYLVAGMIYAESSNLPSAVSRVGARGLMQLMPDTAVVIARELGMSKTARKIRKDHSYLNRNEEINIKFGTKYIRDLYDKIGSWKGAVHAYNQGYTRYRKGHRSHKYVRKVFDFRKKFEKI